MQRETGRSDHKPLFICVVRVHACCTLPFFTARHSALVTHNFGSSVVFPSAREGFPLNALLFGDDSSPNNGEGPISSTLERWVRDAACFVILYNEVVFDASNR